MPAYRAAGYIATALESVFAQTWSDYEVIVVNDGSPDTEELEQAIGPYRHRITYLVKPHGGEASARNAAAREAQGEWIAALDADDYWAPEYLATQVRFLEDHPDADIVYGDGILFGDVPESGRRYTEICPSNGEVDFAALVEARCILLHSATLVRRQLLFDVGLFDESLVTGTDYDLWLRAAKLGRVIRYHGHALAYYRRHAASLIANPVRATANYLRILEKTRQTPGLTAAQAACLDRRIPIVRAFLDKLEAKQALEAGDTESAYPRLVGAHAVLGERRLKLAAGAVRRAPRLAVAAYRFRSFLQPQHNAGLHAQPDGGLTRRAAWLFTAKALAMVLAIALPMILARRLSMQEFGVYKQAFLIANSFVSLMSLGMGMSAFYFLPRESLKRSSVVSNIIAFLGGVGAVSLAGLVLFPGLVVLVTREPVAGSYSPLIGLLVLLWLPGNALETLAIANREVRLAAMIVVLVQVSRTGLLVGAALIWGSVTALLLAALAQAFLQFAVLLAYVQDRFSGFWRGFDAGLFRRQLSYAVPLGLAGMLYALQADLHNYFVSHRFGASVFAVYAVGCFQLPLMGLLAESMAAVLLPEVCDLQRRNEKAAILRLTLEALRKMALVAFPLFAYLFVVRQEFITFLYTSLYRDSVPIYAVNLLLIPMSILLLDPVQRAYAEYRFALLSLRLVLFGFQVAGLWWATGNYGPLGAVWVVVLAAAAERAAAALLYGRVLGARWRDAGMLIGPLKVAAAAAAAGLVCQLAHRAIAAGSASSLAVLVVCAGVFGASYAALLLVLRVPTESEMALVRAGRLGKVFARAPRPE